MYWMAYTILLLSIWPPIPGWDFISQGLHDVTLCDALLCVKRSKPWKRSATIFARTVMCDFPLKDCSPPVFLLKHWKQDVKEVLRERDEWQVWSIYLELARLTGRHQEVLWRGSTILCQTQKVHFRKQRSTLLKTQPSQDTVSIKNLSRG